MTEHRAYIGLGANLGDPAAQIRAALDTLRQSQGVRIERISSLYRSVALGADGHPNREQPAYVNAVASLLTTLTPEALLTTMLAIEQQGGRVRSLPSAARTIDLDLLLYDDFVLDKPFLQLPHPRMHLRRFVLEPLVEISPQINIGIQGSAREWLVKAIGQAVERL